MSIFKRFLSMFLAICLLTSVLPMTAWAEEDEDTAPVPAHMETKPADGTTTGEPFPENTARSFSFRIPALVTLSDGTLVAAADARWNTTYDGGGLDTIVARSSDNGANWSYTFANYLGDNGNTYSGNSTAFIDPSLAVTADDTIYMLVDLYPSGVALNGNKEEIPAYTQGFNAAGKLLLTDDGYNTQGRSYDHYLDGGKIYTSAGDEVAGYTVDEYFNIYQNGNYVSNLFFDDSPYCVVRTGYLYLTKSTDKGATWEAPKLLPLKIADERVCLVGPGRGLVTQSGTIIFPVYAYTDESAKYTGLIYSTDNGVNWQRSANLSTSGTDIPITTSEATMVELGNGKIRTFFRNDNKTLCYSDFDLTNGTWGTCVNTGVACNSDTELSAIVYSKQVEHDGKLKDVVLVSCPAGPTSQNGTANNNGAARSSGVIYAGLIAPDTYQMTWLDKSVAVTNKAAAEFTGGTYTAEQGFFAYSCLTEQKDNGSVSILYEDSQHGWGAAEDGSNYYTMDFKTYTESDLETALGVTFADETTPDVGGGEDEGEPEEVTVDVTISVGQTETFTDATGYYENAPGNTQPNTTIADMTVENRRVTVIESGKQYLIVNKNTGDILSDTVITVSSTAVNWGNKTGLDTTGKLSVDSTELWTITATAAGYTVVQDGKYLTAAGFYANMSDTETNLTLTYTENGWTILDGETTQNVANVGSGSYYLSDNVGSGYSDGALGTNDTGNGAIYWDIYELGTNVTFEGKTAGTTTAKVGNTTYNITVVPATVTKVENVTLKVGESKDLTDDTGNYRDDVNNIAPNGNIVTMELVGSDGTPGELVFTETDRDKITYRDLCAENTDTWVASPYGIAVDGNKYPLYVIRKESYGWYDFYYGYLKDGTVTALIPLDEQYSDINCSADQVDSTISQNAGLNTWGYLADYEIYQAVQGEGTKASTTISFRGVAPGNTVAVVGNTQYNITVLSEERTVDIELEVGETFTYTDTTGSYANRTDHTQPNGSYVTMDVQGASADTRTAVTTLESGRRYLIINKKSGELLTDQAATVSGNWGSRDALATIPEAEAESLEWWTITESNGKYAISQNGKYLAIAGFVAYMYDTETLLTLNYTDQGWTIYDNTTGQTLGHGDPGYYLSDNVGNNYSGSAQGTSDAGNDAMYWDIVEIPYTDVTFTGVAEGTTTAKVGNTTYNITVVPQEVDDEVANTQTDGWTVDPEIQEQRITAATVENTGYTDASWEAYEEALTAAQNKLAELTSTVYTSSENAQDALDAMDAVVDALEAAKDALIPGKNITIRYWRLGEVVEEETISVPLDAVTYELPATRTFNGESYTVSPTHLTVAGNVSEFNIHLLKEYDVTSGIIGGVNIKNRNTNEITNVAARPVTEMTVTVGIEYDLGLSDILVDGQTIEWSSDNTAVATVDADGKVTAVAEGTANITAKIKNGDTVVKTYTIPITVLPAAGNVNKRTVAMYVDNIDNTTVTCVLHANNEKWAFDVVEGELIYGQFQMTGTTSTSTGADSVTGLTFFGNPDDRHALVYMSSTNSFGHYFPLHIGGKVVGDATSATTAKDTAYSGYYANPSSAAAKWLAIGLSGNDGVTIKDDVWLNKIVAMAQEYADAGYDGAQGFTRRTTEGDLTSNLSFVSDPMPEIDKTVDGVLPTGGKFANYQRYVPNMVAAVNEIVFFKITVTLERPETWQVKDNQIVTDQYGKKSAITFTDAVLTDTKLEDPTTDEVDAYFYTKELDEEDKTWDGIIGDNEKRLTTQDITTELNKGWADNEQIRVLEYYLVYQIQSKDVPKFKITNTVSLDFQYTSSYSSGNLSSNADAEADITVIGVPIDNVVIDFGQTIVYTGLTNEHLKGAFVDGENDDGKTQTSKVAADYGTVTVTRKPITVNGQSVDANGYPYYEYTVTYTPTAILQGPDMVRIYGPSDQKDENGNIIDKVVNGFIVYPATTVYYEEGFAFPKINSPGQAGEWDMTTGSWDLTNAKTATVEQTLEKLGKPGKNSQNEDIIVSDKQNPYGFDPVYNTADPDGEPEDDNEASDEFKPVYSHDALNGSFAESHTMGDRTRFTFTGNGIQLFAHCTPDSGYVSVEVRQATAPYRIVRLAIVNTQMLKGDTDATIEQTGSMDSLPVASLINVQNMPHGQYIVTITKSMDSNPVYIDGIRIFNTVAPSSDNSPFTIDYEDHPSFYELRDAVLYAVGADTDGGVEGATEDYIGKVTQQIYDGISGASAVVIDRNVAYANSGMLQDLLDNGPKNELFLYPGQSLTFNVTTDRCMQVGLKAPQGKTTASLTAAYRTGNGEEKTKSSTPTVSSAVDMFYYLADEPAGETVTYTVTIENTGDKILSLTLLKICDDPQAAFAQLTREDIEKVLTAQNAPITIITQPVDAEVKMGERFNVEVTAAGDNLKYQWYYRNAGSSVWQKSGVRDNTYDDVMTKARAGREVYCVITDAAGNSVTTNTVKLIAKSGTTLAILQQPTDAAAKVGERYCVEVIATGEDLQYRWYFRNGGTGVFHQSGVTDNTYDDVMTMARAGREVYCVITDSSGHSVATNTVKLIALPRISLEIVQQPADSAAGMGERFSVEVLALGENLKYQWYYRNAGSVEFVASGVRDNTYDDVMTNARAGREVYCVITDGYGNSVTTDLAKLVLIPKETLEILQQPTDASAKIGERYCVEVIAKGDGLGYTWYFRNAGSETWHKSGVVDNTYDDVMTKARAGREVYCVITDACGNQVTTETVRLIAVPEETLEILQQPVDAAAMLGERYCVEVLAKGEGLRYTWYFRNPGSGVWYKSGVTDNTYDDVMTKARAGRQVYCVITDVCGNTVTTEIVTLVCIKEPQMVTIN